MSKGTLYVYFDSKERLFHDLIRDEKDRQFPAIFAVERRRPGRAGDADARRPQFARFIIAPHVVMAMRTVVAMAGACRTSARSSTTTAAASAPGGWRSTSRRRWRRARSPSTMSTSPHRSSSTSPRSTLSRPLHVRRHRRRPSEERIDAVVKSAVDVFLAAYGRAPAKG